MGTTYTRSCYYIQVLAMGGGAVLNPLDSLSSTDLPQSGRW